MYKQRARFYQVGAVAAVMMILFIAAPAQAELGGNTASIENDRAHVQGRRRMIAGESYTVHEIQAGNSTVMKEYVSAAGMVFAVSWSGPWMPDLRQLLGNYFETYRAAVQAQSGGHIVRRPVTVNQPGLVVQADGHVRGFSGRAYLPDVVPSGVRVEEIQ